MTDDSGWPAVRRYSGAALGRVAMPVGGIGTGCVSLGGRGQLRDRELFNRPAKGFTPDSFFCVRAADGEAVRTRVQSLPALLAAAAALCLAGAVTVLVLPGVTPLSVLLGAVLAGPAAAALVATVDEIAATGRAGVRSWWGRLRALWAFGIRHALLAAALLAVFLVALTVWRQRPEPRLLPSLGLSGGCAVLALSALPAVLALGAAREGRSGRLLWLCALHLLARRPLRFLAGPSLALLGVWAATAWSASLLLLVPAPVAVVMVTAVRTTTAETVTAEAAARPGGELPPQRRKSGESPSSAE